MPPQYSWTQLPDLQEEFAGEDYTLRYNGRPVAPPPVPPDMLVREATKSEFLAMTEEEQKGFIVVTDEDSSFRQDIYSTEEQVVGRWIDGRPLYRRVLSGKVNSASFNLPEPSGTVRMCTYISMAIISESNPRSSVVSTGYNEMKVYYNDGVFFVGLVSSWVGRNYNLIYEYTKTTD